MNKSIFKTKKETPQPDTLNAAGGLAYSLNDQETLVQLVMTGTFNGTFYNAASDQNDKLATLLPKLDSEFIGKVAIYGRENGLMKDMPAYLVAFLATRQDGVLEKVFPRVINNFKMLSNFCQIIRSGAVGRKSFGRRPRRLIRQWLNNQDPVDLWAKCIGGDPSLVDIIKMVHPNFESPTSKNVIAYILDKEYSTMSLPEEIRSFERFKAGDKTVSLMRIPFLRLTSLPLTVADWQSLVPSMGYQALRINLNTLVRQGALENVEVRGEVINRLKDVNAIKRSNTMPYQLLAAFMNFDKDAVAGGISIANALQDAMELATENVPSFTGKSVAICCDVSGSMQHSVTGYRKGATSKVRCVDVAGLMSACLLRNNQEAVVVPFEDRVVTINLNSRDSVMTNTQKLAAIGGGGTNCASAMQHLIQKGCKQDIVIYVSDNMSWAHDRSLMEYWAQYKRQRKNAKLVLIDVIPNAATPANTGPDILNIGGFSDNIWEVIENFVAGNGNLLQRINTVTL